MTHTQRYFVGIGAQRAGTTWLARMFEAHPQIGMSPVKETHYWSSKYVDHQRNAVRGLRAARKRIPLMLRHCRAHPSKTLAWLKAYAGMMAHRDVDYRRFIELGRYGAPVAGEITPAYATLPKSGIVALDACLDQPKYLFVLRNPADRFISQIALTAQADASVLKDSVAELLARPYFALRSSYRETHSAYRQVIAPERLMVVFYEDLFDASTTQDTMDRICTFLGVDPIPSDISRVVNARSLPALRIKRQDIVEALRDDYHFGQTEFGAALPKSWLEDLYALNPTAIQDRVLDGSEAKC